MPNQPDVPTCFVIMPFAAEFDDVWEDAIGPAAATAGFRCIRADDTISPGSIMKDVVARIFAADVIVADLSNLNPNVFYELGIAHTIGDKTVMLCDKANPKLPFDLSDYRTLFYERSRDGLRNLKRQLVERLRTVPAWSSDATNPVRQFGPAEFRVPYKSHGQQDAMKELLRWSGRVALRGSAERRGDKNFVRDSDATVLAAIESYLEEPDRSYASNIDLAYPLDHIIVTGSPRYNPMAERIQQYFNLPYEFVFASAEEEPNRRALRIVTIHGDELSSSRDNFIEDRVSGVDYGILLVGNLSRGKRVLWLGGVHGKGTLGAYKCLVTKAQKILADYRLLGREENTAVTLLVRVHYDASSDESSLDGIEPEILGQVSVCRHSKGTRVAKALFVDLGGVLMDFDRTRTYRALAHLLQLDYKEVQHRIESSNVRQSYERGEFSDSEFCAKVCALFGEGAKKFLPMLPELWADIFWPNREMFEALRLLKRQNVIIALVSNTNSLHFSHVSKDYPELIDLFDKRFLSYELGREKPNSGVYEEAVSWAARQHRIVPSDILYVDDIEEYVQAARAHGLTGFVYRSYSHFAFWLRKQGLYVP
jgi:FMN phosphatase YigB (HAD superfamily)